MLQKHEAIHQQIFDLEPSLVQLHFSNRQFLALSISWCLLFLNEVWHEMAVGDDLQPSESEAGVLIWVQIFE